jgi:hypothetical protein
MSIESLHLNILYLRNETKDDSDFDSSIDATSATNIGGLKSLVISSLRNKLSAELSKVSTENLDAIIVVARSLGNLPNGNKKWGAQSSRFITTANLNDTDSISELELDGRCVLWVKEIYYKENHAINSERPARVAEITLTPKESTNESNCISACVGCLCEFICCWVEVEVDNKLESASNNVRGGYAK